MASTANVDSKQKINNDQQVNQNEILTSNVVFPFQRSLPGEPPDEYNRLRTEQPICRSNLSNGKQAWLISRYGDVCLVLGDNEHFSKVENIEDIINTDSKHGLFLNLDPKKRSVYRQILEKEFSPNRIKEYETRMKNIIDDLFNQLINQKSPTDFVSQFASKVPPSVLYDLLGISKIDYEFVNSQTQSNKELFNYINRLIENKKQTPVNDVISRLINDQLTNGKINQEELLNIILMLLQSGNNPIKNLICLGTISLLQNKEQLDKIREDISLIDNAVEEILRYHTGLSFITRRLTIKDIEINGQMIKTGDHVFALNASANRDEQVLSKPNVFDIDRPPQHHLAFGYGVFQCVGMHLVRALLKLVFTTIIQRLPNLKLDQSIDNIQFITDSNQDIGVQKLILSW